MSLSSPSRSTISMEEEEEKKGSCLSIQDQDHNDRNVIKCMASCGISDDHGFCAICLERIPLQETALVKGCEHAYCVTCILIWATYNQNPSCPQCKHPFEFLNVHRSLDGSIRDYMFEESVCLLVRATWFVPFPLEAQEEVYEDQDGIYQYDYDDDDDGLDEAYYSSSSSIRIGNRRWGNNGYVRAGRREARPIDREHVEDPGAGSGSSRGQRNKEASKDVMGRRAKRAMKREAADKAAAAKHQQHLQRLGRK